MQFDFKNVMMRYNAHNNDAFSFINNESPWLQLWSSAFITAIITNSMTIIIIVIICLGKLWKCPRMVNIAGNNGLNLQPQIHNTFTKEDPKWYLCKGWNVQKLISNWSDIINKQHRNPNSINPILKRESHLRCKCHSLNKHLTQCVFMNPISDQVITQL